MFPSLSSLFPPTSQACLFHQKCFRPVIRHCCSFGCEVSWTVRKRQRQRERGKICEDAHLRGGPWHQQGHEGGPHLKDPLLRCNPGWSQHPLSFCRSSLHDVSLFNFGREVSRWKAVIISRVILVAKLPVRRSFPSPHDMHSNYLEAHKHISEGC